MDKDQLIKNKRDEFRRRNRVRAIKNIIYILIIIWMMAGIIFSMYFFVTIKGLREDIMNLNMNQQTLQQQIEEEALKKRHQIEMQSVEAENEESEDEVETETVVDANATKVYLTFDDGPTENTDKVLDILKQADVKATFFVIGRTDPESVRRMKRIVDEGHTIAMHTYSHVYEDIYSNENAFAADVEEVHRVILENTGVDTRIYRFPGGSSTGKAGGHITEYISYINNKGYRYFDWNVSSGDAQSPPLTPQQILENIMNDVLKYKTSVVLMHDAADKYTTIETLPVLIDTLKSQGAVILPINDDTPLVQHVTI